MHVWWERTRHEQAACMHVPTLPSAHKVPHFSSTTQPRTVHTDIPRFFLPTHNPTLCTHAHTHTHLHICRLPWALKSCGATPRCSSTTCTGPLWGLAQASSSSGVKDSLLVGRVEGCRSIYVGLCARMHACGNIHPYCVVCACIAHASTYAYTRTTTGGLSSSTGAKHALPSLTPTVSGGGNTTGASALGIVQVSERNASFGVRLSLCGSR